MYMQKTKGNFRDYVMRLSYQERRKRKLESFNQEVQKLRKMKEDELNFEYITLKTEIDRKNVLSLPIAVIAFVLLMNVWNKFFSFMQMLLQYAANAGADSEEILKIGFAVSVLAAIVLTLAILFFICDLSKDIMKMQRKRMLIEYVKEKSYKE